MIVFEVLRVSFEAIRSNKLRSFLTMLGIIIGIAAVITMVALGEGAQRAVEEQISRLGTNVLTVRPGQGWFRGVRSGDARLTVDDALVVDDRAPAVRDIAPEISTNLQIEYGRFNANIRVVGTTPGYVPVNSHRLLLGRFFDVREEEGRRRLAVLGSEVPEMLGTTAAELVGQQIQIRNVPFEVIGVLEEKGGSGWFSEDDQIFVPLRTAQFRLVGTDRLRSFNVLVEDGVSMTLAMMQIEDVLRRAHRLRPGQENDFWIQDRAELLGTQQETTRTFGFLLAAIAGVSLIVGGIGIMNIMLVSVTERTKEIGLRKALGATRRAVLLQFLIEALVLCMVGGALGIGLGVAGAEILSAAANWNTAVSPQAVLLAVGFAIGVGLFFGLWPARRAARMDPVVALRWE